MNVQFDVSCFSFFEITNFFGSVLSKKQNPFLGCGVQSAQNAVDCELRQVKKKNNKFPRNAA